MATVAVSNHQVLHTLYSDHLDWLQAWLSKKVGCTHHAADLAQDTFVRLLLKKVEACDFTTPRIYLAHIAKGLVIDHWRRQALEREYLNALVLNADEASYSLELQAVMIETLFEIDTMLNTLAPKVRHAFLLAQIDGLTYKEISVIIGVSERMIKKYMANAMMHCLLFKRQLQANLS